MPNIVKKSWGQIWKNSPDSTYDAVPPPTDIQAKQYAKEAIRQMQAGTMTVDQAEQGLQRIQKQSTKGPTNAGGE